MNTSLERTPELSVDPSTMAPESLQALEARVNAHLEQRDIAGALALLNAALLVKETAELWNDWASVQFHAGERQLAEQGFRRALALDGACTQAAENLRALLAQQAPAEDGSPLEQKVERLTKAVEYLLLKQVNMAPSGAPGRSSYDALVRSLWQLLAAIRPKYFFDIGANDASTARRVKYDFRDCEVWAFEANPELHKKFEPAAALAGVRYVNLAIADTCGKIKLYTPRTYTEALIDDEIVQAPAVEPADTGRSSMLRRNEEATYREFEVPSVTLDRLFDKCGITGSARQAVLWVDVEGAAYQVLSAAKEALKNTAVLFVEAENHLFWTGQKRCSEVAQLLIGEGFIPIDRDREYGDKQFNTLFVHQSLLHLVYPSTFITRANQPLPSTLESSPRPAAPAAPVRRKLTYTSMMSYFTASIPIIIPVFNNPTYAANMLRQLTARGLTNLCLFDNGSTSPEMRVFLEQAEDHATVVRAGYNHGPRHVLVDESEYSSLPEIFCVTDPDLELNPRMPANFLTVLASLSEVHKVGKVGLALRINDRDKMHDTKCTMEGREYHVADWEAQFWKEKVGHLGDGSPVFRAQTDTTFALYNKKFFTVRRFMDGLRVGGTFTCRHLPWYRKNGLGAAEENYYRATQLWSFHANDYAQSQPQA